MSLAPKQGIPLMQSITQSLFKGSDLPKIHPCEKFTVIHNLHIDLFIKTFIIHTRALAIMKT
jgi:hypothetical protein